MGRWSIIAGSMQLLMLIALIVDMAHITSRSTTHQMCSDDEYYDADRESCFDLCRGKECLPDQMCTERIYGHRGPYICGDRCYQPCTLPMYCNTETAYCNRCSNICSYSDKDILRQCRIHCYDIYEDIAASGFQTSTAPLTATDSRRIIGPICDQNEYYDADRDMCLDMCGESKCQLHQICSTKVGGYTGPHFCVDRCKPTCDSSLYCSKETGNCEPCLDICNDQNEDTLRQCTIYCYDICTVIGLSHTSAAGPRLSTSTDLTLTSDESIQPKQRLVSKPNYLVPVVSCSLAVFATALCMRICRVKQNRGEPQRTTGTASLMSNTPAMKIARWSIMARTLQLLMLVAVSVDMAYISSQSITNPICSSDEYYDADRDTCLDMCGEYKCQTHQKCSQKIPAYTGTHRCIDLCYKPCASPLYCNIKTALCDPCDDICNDHNEDTLRQCRQFCLDVYKEIVVSRTSTALPPPTSDESITSEQIPVFESTQLSPGKVAASVLVPVVICGVLLAVIVFCKRKHRLQQQMEKTSHTEEAIPLNTEEAIPLRTEEAIPLRAEEAIPLRTVEDIPLHTEEPTPLMPSNVTMHNEIRRIITSSCHELSSRITLDDELWNLLGQHAPHMITTNTKQKIQAKKTPYSQVTALLEFLQKRTDSDFVNFCKSLVAANQKFIVKDYFREALRYTGKRLVDIELELYEQPDSSQQRPSESDLDQYMTQLKESYRQQIEERDQMEKNQYGNVIPLDQHQPVIINHGLKGPDRQERRAYDEFVIEKSGREQLTLENFLHDDGRGRPRSVLMLGGPGMGKTSICHTILDWFVRGKWMDHQYIFFISLKGLVSMATSVSLADILFDYSTALSNRENKETFIKQVEERQKETLIVLDGYDECEEFMKDQLNVSAPTVKAKPGAILKNLVRGKMLPDAQVLLTSRPFKSTNEDLGVKRVVQLAGLAATSVMTLLGKNVTSKMDLPTIPDDITSLLSIPINLQKFLSYLTWVILEDWKFPQTKTSLYSVQMLPVLRQTLKFDDFNPTAEIDMWSNPLVVEFLGNLAKLASTAFDELGSKQILFQTHQLKQCRLDEHQVKQGGLMTSFTRSTLSGHGMCQVIYFYFIHLTNLEWVGGLYIANTTLDNIRGLIKRNEGQLDVILCFAVGLLGDIERQEILKSVHGMSSDDCRDKADKMLSEIVKSHRCTKQSDGRQYALEVFHEGQFTRPHLLQPLLAPDGHALEVTRIAHYNRHVVHYFLSQLIALQDGQIEQAEAATEISNIDTMMLHFVWGADVSVQEGILSEVGRLKKLKYLSIDTDGAFKAAVEQPLKLLTVCGEIDGDDAAHIIGNNSASVLCLINKAVCDLPGSWRPSKDLKEILLVDVGLHRNTMRNIEAGSSLRVIMWLWYDDDTAADVRRLIHKTPALQAVGLRLDTDDKADCIALSCVVSASSVACLSLLWVEPDNARHMEVIRDSLDNASLRELWLLFYSPPSAAVQAELAGWVCRHGRLTTLSLVCRSTRHINVSCLLRQLVDKPHSLHHIYTTDDISSVEDDVAKSFTGVLQQVRGDDVAACFTPLVYSEYLLTSIPTNVKKLLTRRYASLRH